MNNRVRFLVFPIFQVICSILIKDVAAELVTSCFCNGNFDLSGNQISCDAATTFPPDLQASCSITSEGTTQTCESFCQNSSPCSGDFIECDSVSNGVGDPHFRGFDSSKFDFHGIHDKNYIIFAQKNGDILTARMRATPELYLAINKTYMSEFGIQIAKSPDKIHFFIRRDHRNTTKLFRLQTTVNGKEVYENIINPKYNISFDQISVSVQTEKNKFIIKGISLNSIFRRHVDISVQRRKKKADGDRFTGVVGRTMHHLDSHIVRISGLKRWERYIDFEKHLREAFETDKLFPIHSKLMHLYLMNQLVSNCGLPI